MTLIKLINIIESLKKNPRSLKKWTEVAELVQENSSDSVYDNICNLIKRDASAQAPEVIETISKMILKFPREYQINIISHLKKIDHSAVCQVFIKLPIQVVADYGILDYYFNSSTVNPISQLSLHFQKEQTLMDKSCHVWIPLGIRY
jgi:hypothetical protein